MIFTQKQKTVAIALITLILLFLGLDLFIPQALAAPNINGNDYVKEIASKMEIFHQFFSPLINFLSTNIGNFLNNDHIFNGTMGEMLKSLWVISRNLGNIFFVGALLWVALKAVAGDFFGEETDLKKELLKIAVFLVIINFSWLATKVVLDASNVATNVAFSLPTGISNVTQVDLGKCSIDPNTGQVKGPCKPTEIHFVATATTKNDVQHLTDEECKAQQINEAYKDIYPEGTGGNLNPTPQNQDNVEKYANKSTFCWSKLDLFDYNQNTAVVYLTYGMAKIQNIGESFSLDQNYAKMSIASIFGLLIQITFSLSLVALFILMLIRTALLWLFVGFSPALVIMLYLGGGEGPISNFGPKDFIKWAFVPAQVGIVLSVGFIMIAAGESSSTLLSALNHNVNMEGGFYDSISIFSGMDSVFGLIWLIMIELIFAIAVYAPMKDLPFAGTIIGPIAEFAKSTLTSLAKTPLVAPIIPITDKGTPSWTSLRDVGQGFRNKIEWRTGASSDVATVRRLENEARDFSAKMQSDSRIQEDILNELRSGNLDTLSRNFDSIRDLRSVDDDTKEDTLEKTFTFNGSKIGKEQIREIINLLNEKEGSSITAPVPNPTPAAASLTAPVPDPTPAAASLTAPVPDPNKTSEAGKTP